MHTAGEKCEREKPAKQCKTIANQCKNRKEAQEAIRRKVVKGEVLQKTVAFGPCMTKGVKQHIGQKVSSACQKRHGDVLWAHRPWWRRDFKSNACWQQRFRCAIESVAHLCKRFEIAIKGKNGFAGIMRLPGVFLGSETLEKHQKYFMAYVRLKTFRPRLLSILRDAFCQWDPNRKHPGGGEGSKSPFWQKKRGWSLNCGLG